MFNLGQFNPNKLLSHYEKVCALLKGKNVYPVTIEINPTNICNHHCVWCTYGYLKKTSSKNDTLSKELLLRIVRQICQLDSKAIIWTGGGEPFMNKTTFEGMKLAARNGLEQAVHTNGSLLNREISVFLVKNFTYIRISFDAASEETHMKLHRAPRGDFKRILQNIKTLVSLKKKYKSPLTIGISFLLHMENWHEISKIIKIAKKLKVDYLQFKPIIIWGFDKQLPIKYLKKAFKEIERIKLNENGKFSIRVLDYKFHDIINDRGRFGRSYLKCLGHPLVGSIAANGSVDLCCSFKGLPKWSFGNLKQNSFKEIWNGVKRKKIIKQIDFSKCEPLCRIHEINKILDYMKNYKYHKNFI